MDNAQCEISAVRIAFENRWKKMVGKKALTATYAVSSRNLLMSSNDRLGGRVKKMHRYHCFWFNPFGMEHKYEATDDFARVEQLVKAHEAYKTNSDHSTVAGLRVVNGRLLEFEAVETVTRWRVKNDS